MSDPALNCRPEIIIVADLAQRLPLFLTGQPNESQPPPVALIVIRIREINPGFEKLDPVTQGRTCPLRVLPAVPQVKNMKVTCFMF